MSIESRQTSTEPVGLQPWSLVRGRGRVLLGVGLIVLIGLIARVALPDGAGVGRGVLPWLDTNSVTLYFPDRSQGSLVPVTRTIDSKADFRLAVAELAAGPRDREHLDPAFAGDPPTVSVEGTTAVVSYPVSGAPEAVEIRAIEQTLLALPAISTVRIDGAGKAHRPGRSSTALNLYYADGAYLVPVAAPAGVTNIDDVVTYYLASTGRDTGLVKLPSDVSLVNLRLDQERRLLVVDLTYTESLREFALANELLTRRVLQGLIATLTQFDSVDAVLLSFEGHTRLGLGGCSDLLRAPQVAPDAINDEAQVLILAKSLNGSPD